VELGKPLRAASEGPIRGELWFTELHTPGAGFSLRVRRTLHSERTPFQEIALVETEDFGRVLILDGTIQLTELDEFIYHEMLVHVPMCAHPRPRRVLVIGGGDGGCVREALRHPGVEEVVLVEIDRAVLDCCRKYLPGVAGRLDDPRVEVRIEDGVKFLRRHRGAFDVIIVDSTDPVGMAGPLTREPFFRAAREALAPRGLYAAQSQGPVFEGGQMRRVARAARRVFRSASFYLAATPTYPGGLWSFLLAARGGRPPAARPPRRLPARERTRYYSPAVHRAAFALPPFVEEFVR